MIGKLSEIGWLYRRMKNKDSKANDKNGLIYQSLVSAVDKELSEYYRLIALLEQQNQPILNENSNSRLTLRRLFVWLQQPLQRMRWLGIIFEGSFQPIMSPRVMTTSSSNT